QSNQFVPQAVLLMSGKVSIPAARPNQVTAGRSKPVSTGRPKPISIGAPVSTVLIFRPSHHLNFLSITNKCIMMGMDGQLLLSPQQVVLGRHIEIRHYFIRDANEKKLIQVLKIHTDDNVADLLTKAFDGPRFNHLMVNIGMLNP
ncbi:hypothetical protein Tco_0658646, partial [Tanacetum coccineum]